MQGGAKGREEGKEPSWKKGVPSTRAAPIQEELDACLPIETGMLLCPVVRPNGTHTSGSPLAFASLSPTSYASLSMMQMLCPASPMKSGWHSLHVLR